MATENSNTSPTKQALCEAITNMDSLSQQNFGWIESVSRLIKVSIDQGIEHKYQSDDIREAVSLIQYLATDAMNSINCEAEDVGCHYTSRKTKQAFQDHETEGASNESL